MISTSYSELLEYALRAHSSYVISELGWALGTHLGWHRSQRELLIKEMPNSEVNVIVEYDPEAKCQWIAIRGSSNLRNWLLNLRYIQRECDPNDPTCGGIDLHRGFRAAATEVFQAISPIIHPELPIRLTGHSLGGAIASILMLFFHELNFNVEKCVTFGQPKITDHQGAIANQSMPLVRVVHDDDIVPSLPPTTPLTLLQGGYEHFGEQITLRDSEQWSNPLSHAWHEPQERSTSFWLAIFRTLFQKDIRDINENIEDHNLSHYIQSLIHTMSARNHLSEQQQPLLQTFGMESPQPSDQLLSLAGMA